MALVIFRLLCPPETELKKSRRTKNLIRSVHPSHALHELLNLEINDRRVYISRMPSLFIFPGHRTAMIESHPIFLISSFNNPPAPRGDKS